MKKLDKLVLRAFIGPFILTLFVVVFILLTQLMLNKMDEFVGKDLGVMVLSELMFYFSINLTQTALPLAVLLSSLMAYGNLGEFSELTAIKGAGISLLRTLRPAFILVVVITILAFFNNNYVVTRANLKAYSLLYDIKKHKPSLDIKEGAFYNGIPDFSIKINQKFPDGESLRDIIIYDHSGKQGNTIVTFADSGRMYSVYNDRYLMFELFDGKRYEEIPKAGGTRRGKITDFIRNDFKHSKLVLSLASFDFQKSKEELWQNHYYMKRIGQLKQDVDSMDLAMFDARMGVYDDAQRFFSEQYRERVIMPPEYQVRKVYRDSVKQAKLRQDSIDYREKYVSVSAPDGESDQLALDSASDATVPASEIQQRIQQKQTVAFNQQPTTSATASNSSAITAVRSMPENMKPKNRQANATISIKNLNLDSLFTSKKNQSQGLRQALSVTRNIKNKINVQTSRLRNQQLMITKYKIEVNKKYAQAFACLVMFLIGAPLGAIIKRGGLGVPVIISIIFFILYYVLSITGKKWAEEDVVTPFMGIWGFALILLPIGFFFLRQARNDARLLESDFYAVIVEKIKTRWGKKNQDENP